MKKWFLICIAAILLLPMAALAGEESVVTQPSQGSMTFVVTNANAAAYQWQVYNYGNWTDIYSANSPTLLDYHINAYKGCKVRCVAAYYGGEQLISAEVQLLVNVISQPTPDNMTFQVENVMMGSPRWEAKGEHGNWYSIQGAINFNYLTKESLKTYAGKTVRCVLNFPSGQTIISDEVTLNEVILTQPSEGSMTFVVSNSEKATFQWERFDGSTWFPIGSEKKSTLSSAGLDTFAGYKLRCVATYATSSAKLVSDEVPLPVAVIHQPTTEDVFFYVKNGGLAAAVWYVKEQDGSWTKIEGTDGSPRLSLEVQKDYAGETVRCVLQYPSGQTVTSDEVRLYDTILTQPTPEQIVFEVTHPSEHSYRWQVEDGGQWRTLAGETANALSAKAIRENAGKKVRAVAVCIGYYELISGEVIIPALPLPPAPPPQTGDEATPAAWLVMMLASALCLTLMRKRA